MKFLLYVSSWFRHLLVFLLSESADDDTGVVVVVADADVAFILLL